jgi:hypothetical protein
MSIQLKKTTKKKLSLTILTKRLFLDKINNLIGKIVIFRQIRKLLMNILMKLAIK